MKQTDVCVIGAGPGGYVAAIKLAQLGKKVIVVDREYVGGVCLNCGCIPSKALISAAGFYDKMQHSEEMGLSIKGATVDFKKMQTWKESVVSKLTGGVAQLLKGNGCEYLAGSAKFKSPQELEIKMMDGKTETIKATNFVIATGSRPIEIPGFAFDKQNVLSSTEALELDKLPKRLAVIGGGYIGLEIGSFYQKFGVDVTVIEATAGLLLGVADQDCVQVVARKLKKRGVKVLLNAKAVSYKKTGDSLVVKISINGAEQEIPADKILVTVGRRPNSDQLGLSEVGVKIDKRGFIEADKQLRTNIPHIFAIGDIAGQPMLAHKASKEGIICAEVISGKNSVMDVKAIPAVIFTDPEIASVGLTADEAKAKGFDISIGQFPYGANGRALTMMDSDGFIKIITDKKNNLVLGVHIVGYEASNLISEAALALEMGATAEDIASTIHPHPTLPEMMMEAAESAMGHAIHIMAKPERERRTPSAASTSSH